MPTSIKVIFVLWVFAIIMIPIMRLINRIFYEEVGDWLTLVYADVYKRQVQPLFVAFRLVKIFQIHQQQTAALPLY